MVDRVKLIKYSTIALVGVVVLTGCTDKTSYSNVNNEVKLEQIEKESSVKEISINFFGDLLIHNSIYDAAKTSNGYDFTYQFEDIKDKVTIADYTVGNLEVPIGNKDFSNYPSFRAPAQLATAMKDVLDVELLTTASNHTLDKGFSGLKETLNCLDNVDIKHTGSARTEEEASNILIEDIKGVKVAFLAYTYGTNGYPIPSDAKYCINLIDKDKIKNDTLKAKELGADFIVVKMHWGEEYVLDENSNQKNLAKYIFEETEANLIIGEHPHVVQNIEKMIVEKDGKEKEGVVVYSLGNFISGQNKDYRDTGIIAKVNLSVDKENPENTKVNTIEYTPVFVDRNSSNTGKRVRVVDINESILNYENKTDDLISKEEYNKLIKYRDYYRNKLLQDGFVKEL